MRNKSIKELEEIRQLREKIDLLAKQAREKDLLIESEQRKLYKERELVLLRFNDAKRKEEIAQLEKERLKDAKHNMNLRYASIPRRSDLYPYPYFREFYGGPTHPVPPVVNNIVGGGHHGHCCSEDVTPLHRRCLSPSCGKEKTTFIMPPVGPRSGHNSWIIKNLHFVGINQLN